MEHEERRWQKGQRKVVGKKKINCDVKKKFKRYSDVTAYFN